MGESELDDGGLWFTIKLNRNSILLGGIIVRLKIDEFFRTDNPIFLADLIVVKIEEENKYFVYKYRYDNIKHETIIDEHIFKCLLSVSQRPIVLSDVYIDISK